VAPTHFTIRLLRLPTRGALDAAHGVATTAHRLLTVVGVHVDNDLATTAGWGECSALNEVGYTHESAIGAFELLRSGRPFAAADFPMASAAIEMALLDADLKQAGETLAERLGTAGQSAVAGAVVGLGPIPSMLHEVEDLVDQGYRRIKCKIAPGKTVVPLRAVRTSFPEVELHVDANASLVGSDAVMLRELRDLGVTAIEQPFAIHDHQSAIRLVGESDMQVIADEAVTDPASVEAIARDRSATAIALKPSKLGGVHVGLDILDQAHAAGLGVAIGGMLESGLGRHVLAAFAPLPAFTVVGDLSSASRWLAEDPFPDITLRKGKILAPKRAGIAGHPNERKLQAFTIRKAFVGADAACAALAMR